MKKLIIKDMADVCEEAHELTVKECKRKNITVDTYLRSNDEVTYTPKAQLIFDKHYEYLIERYNI